MTVDELTARGLRVKPLEWNKAGEARHLDRIYLIVQEDFSTDTWRLILRFPFADSEHLVEGVTRSEAIAAANAHHAAQVAARIEVIE